MVFDREGNLWAVGSGGAVRWDSTDGTYTKYTVDQGLVSNRVQCVAVAPDGAVWAAAWGGVSRFDGESWATYTVEDGLADDFVRSIGVGPDGALWFATDGGLSRYAPGE